MEECDRSLLNDREKYYIKLYNTYFDGYNDTTGGDNGTENACCKISKEQLLEIYNLLQNSNLSQKEIAVRYNIGQDVVSTINHGKSRRLDGYSYPLRSHDCINYCCDCGIAIHKKSIRCDACNKIISRKVIRPSRDVLKEEIRTTTFRELSYKYNVSDKAIVKWCKSYNLPHTKSLIKTYSDYEWELI